ncbi:MAG: DUF6311 domain-containing protein [Polyangiaceae bacterium]
MRPKVGALAGGTGDRVTEMGARLFRNVRWESALVRLVLSFCVALVVFGVSLNFWILNPTHIKWILSTNLDVTTYFFSFAYFRRAAWGFPLAHFDSLSYPIGTSLLVMDGLPLAAIPLKLFNRFLPDRFQFLGPWVFLNVWLQCFFAERFLRRLELPSLWRWVGAILATTAPPFMQRFGHVALSSHWVILLALASVCSEVPEAALWFAPILALCIHPYLFAMVLALSMTGQLRFARTPGALRRVALMAVGLLGSLWLLGYFQMPETRNGRFEYYSSDLTSLFNSMGSARFLPSRALGDGPSEGSAYLGCGGLVLCLALLITLAVPLLRRRSAQIWWLFAASSAMALYALSIGVHFLGVVVVRLDFLWPIIEPFASRFRSCGRFIWPLFYYLLFFGLKALHGLGHGRRWLDFGAPALLALQIADIWPGLAHKDAQPSFNVTTNVSEVPAEISSQLTPDTRLLIFEPPVKTRCGSLVWHGPYQHLAWFGALHGLKSNANLGEARSVKGEGAAECRYTTDMYRHRAKHPEAIFIRQ